MEKNILLLISHPDFSKSRVNKALAQKASQIPHVTVRHLDEVQKENHYSIEEEFALLKKASHIVWLFPVHWYNAPSSLRLWQDEVLSPILYGPENFLKGKKVLVACSAGAAEVTFSPTGLNRFTAEEMLRPMQMTTNACSMEWLEPFVTFGAGTITDAQINVAAEKFVTLLQKW